MIPGEKWHEWYVCALGREMEARAKRRRLERARQLREALQSKLDKDASSGGVPVEPSPEEGWPAWTFESGSGTPGFRGRLVDKFHEPVAEVP